jgi:hypothetical protein
MNTVPVIDCRAKKTSLCRFVMLVLASMALASVEACQQLGESHLYHVGQHGRRH